MRHPIFGDVCSSEREREERRRIEAAVLREKMEAIWRSPRVVNFKRPARYVGPGSSWGHQDEICGW
jgi:hypothetical protein